MCLQQKVTKVGIQSITSLPATIGLQQLNHGMQDRNQFLIDVDQFLHVNENQYEHLTYLIIIWFWIRLKIMPSNIRKDLAGNGRLHAWHVWNSGIRMKL